jgi:hypothetical protein
MSWLVLAFALQIGYTPNDAVMQYAAAPSPSVWDSESALIISMDVELQAWNLFYVGGSLGVPTWVTNQTIVGYQGESVQSSFGGWPQSLQSIIRAGVRIPMTSDDSIEIGWSHLCTHPVMPYQPIYGEQTQWEGGYDEFHIKFSGKVHF